MVLAVDLAEKIVIGVYVADKWLAGTKANFPELKRQYKKGFEKRLGFIGHEADLEIQDLYLHKEMPEKLVKAQNSKYTHELDGTPKW